MIRSPLIPLALGAVVVSALALADASVVGNQLVDRLSAEARQAIAEAGGAGVEARFRTAAGWPTRHPVLVGGGRLREETRDRTAKAVAAVPGVGGIRWADSTGLAAGKAVTTRPLHCQDDVEALLRSRTIRFEESSVQVDQTSQGLLDEVSDALLPCLGSIIAITGHTDASGPEPGNLALSQARAEAVRLALIARGIPADGLRAQGLGSAHPVPGLSPDDPANRRIEFSVIASVPIKPTPVDTPGPR